MRMKKLMSAVVVAMLVAGGATASGCKKHATPAGAAAESTSNLENKDATITEAHEGGKITWYVGPDGQVEALVTTKDGKPAENLTGTLTWKGPNAEAKLTMTPDPKTGKLSVLGPGLAGDLTEIKYTVMVNGKPWTGALDVPEGGTQALVVSAKAATKKDAYKGKKGPNGGVVQVVGDDVVEIVGDKGTGQVRVYALDPDLKPIKIGDRKIKLGVVGSSSEVVVLTPDPGGLYCFGKFHAKVDPFEITIAETWHGHTDVVLVGWSPDVDIVLFGVPMFAIFVVDLHWGGVIVEVDDDYHWHGHGHGHGRWH